MINNDFQIASLNGYSDFVRLLVDHGANKTVETEVSVESDINATSLYIVIVCIC